MITFKPINYGQIQELCSVIKQTRDAGVVHCRISEIVPVLESFVNADLQSRFNSDLISLIDEFTRDEWLKPLKDSWFEVNEDTANWILNCILSQDLAYRSPLTSKGKAGYLTDQFITLVKGYSTDERLRFFTNGSAVPGPPMYDLNMQHMSGWNPATEATFDTGVVIVSRYRIGLTWVEDED